MLNLCCFLKHIHWADTCFEIWKCDQMTVPWCLLWPCVWSSSCWDRLRSAACRCWSCRKLCEPELRNKEENAKQKVTLIIYFFGFCYVAHIQITCNTERAQGVRPVTWVETVWRVTTTSDSRCWVPVVLGGFFREGRLGEDSGRGATGWTGLVCLADSLFRLTCRFSNISWTSSRRFSAFRTSACRNTAHHKPLVHRHSYRLPVFVFAIP